MICLPTRGRIFRRCDNITRPEDLTWDTRCYEDNYPHCESIAYGWQAEFRSYKLWTQLILDKYKYMLWWDSDAMATKPWLHDPVTFMIKNDLVLLSDNFPQGFGRRKPLQDKIRLAFNGSVCGVDLKDGHLNATRGDCLEAKLGLVHGFFYLANLDVYRSKAHEEWGKILVGDTKYSRQFDDQIFVTIPAAVLHPERAWDMHSTGLSLGVWHNRGIDGKHPLLNIKGYTDFFKIGGHESLHACL